VVALRQGDFELPVGSHLFGRRSIGRSVCSAGTVSVSAMVYAAFLWYLTCSLWSGVDSEHG
jgi:hypothetical protein